MLTYKNLFLALGGIAVLCFALKKPTPACPTCPPNGPCPVTPKAPDVIDDHDRARPQPWDLYVAAKNQLDHGDYDGAIRTLESRLNYANHTYIDFLAHAYRMGINEHSPQADAYKRRLAILTEPLVGGFGALDPTKPRSKEPLGVDATKIRHGRVTVNGREVAGCSDSFVLSLFDSTMADDSTLPFITVIGQSREQVERVLNDLEHAPELTPHRGHFRVQGYLATDWAVQPGFYTAGSPTIYVQQASGLVIHRQDSYTGAGPLAEVLRKVNDAYDARKDPNLGLPNIDFANLPAWAWLAIGGAAFYILREKK